MTANVKTTSITIGATQVARWANARKITLEQIAEALADVHPGELRQFDDFGGEVSVDFATRLADLLDVDPEQLTSGPSIRPRAISMSADEIEGSRRSIQRDGIHFYDYYSLPAPHGEVGPVLLDIHCPADRLPALNNGHLEPALTVNLGPGDISGRWSDSAEGDGWEILAANIDPRDSWIIGDSYIEPSFCPHSYALASDVPARILSYTVGAPLGPLLQRCDEWDDAAFERWIGQFDAVGCSAALLTREITRRGWTNQSLAEQAEIPPAVLDDFCAGRRETIPMSSLVALCQTLGVDYRSFLPPAFDHDALGKCGRSVAEARATIRAFGPYEVASLAAATHVPDVYGIFMRIELDDHDDGELDICDSGETHLLVTSGRLTLRWDDGGSIESQTLDHGDAIWIDAHVAFSLRGNGSTIKLGTTGGRGVASCDQNELTRTFSAASTLRAGRRSRDSWGYDAASGGDSK
ncbi:MAG: helix-turn-helix domain-containing protein [Solirubrobacterales bacterium]